MKFRWFLLTVVFGLFFGLDTALGDSIWERSTPQTRNLFHDTRARRVGDLLTIVVRETTLFDGKENRNLRKDTKARGFLDFKGDYKAGNLTERNFDGSMEGGTSSQRELNGKSDFKSDRTFTDRMTVQVVDVLPNGNLVVEGFRRRIVQQEERMLKVTGIVRPIDVGPDNVVQSQYLGNFSVSYLGRGPETSYTSNGWLGRVFNAIWPW